MKNCQTVLFSILFALPSLLTAQIPAGGTISATLVSRGFLLSPDVAMNSRGDFVVGWAHANSGNSGAFGRVYNANGSPKTKEFRLDSRPAERTSGVRLAMMEDGSFVAGLLADSFGIPKVRRFTAKGQPLGGAFAVSSSYASSLDVATRGDGSFVASWTGTSPGIFIRAFGADGQPLGPEVQVVEAITSSGRVAVQPDGSFLVVWVQLEATGPATFELSSIQGRLFDPDGTPAGESFLISEGQPGEPFPVSGYDTAVDGEGDFLVTWFLGQSTLNPPSTFIRRYAPDGSPLGDAVLAGHRPAGQLIAAGPGDRFVSLWQTSSNPSSITVRQLTADGAPAGPLVVLGQVPDGPFTNPALAGDGAGNFVAAWIGRPLPGKGSAFYMRRFRTE